MIAALGNLEVSIMARRQLDTFRRYQIDKRIVKRRQMLVYRLDYLLIGMRSGDFQHLRVTSTNLAFASAQATGNHDFTVLA
ncbi:hypothetical protein D3C83_140290 [compost metagenome]